MRERSQEHSSCLARHRSTSAVGSLVTSAAARPTEATSSKVPERWKETAPISSMARTLGCQPMSEGPPTASHRGRQYTFMAVAAGITLPGAILSRAHPDLPYPLLALIFGLAIIGAAFMLSWAAAVAQLDTSAA